MKRSLLLLTALVSTAFGNPQLPQMSDKTEWLGYFVGWEERDYVFGIGADGELNMQPKKSGKVISHRHVEGRYLVQEEIKGKWVNRSFLPEGEVCLAGPCVKGENAASDCHASRISRSPPVPKPPQGDRCRRQGPQCP